MAQAEIMRTEYAVCDEDGCAFEWFDEQDAAVSFARSREEPCYVEQRVEYFPEKRIVWASHRSMVEA